MPASLFLVHDSTKAHPKAHPIKAPLFPAVLRPAPTALSSEERWEWHCLPKRDRSALSVAVCHVPFRTYGLNQPRDSKAFLRENMAEAHFLSLLTSPQAIG